MPILRLNVGPDGISLQGSPGSASRTIKSAASGAGPVIIMIHGFKYDPNDARNSPHNTIFKSSAAPVHGKDVQWLHHLGFGTDDANEGLAIPFAWPARGSIWQANAAAKSAGHQLAKVINTLRDRAPERPVHVVTHSMGSEVVFEALHLLPMHSVNRVITLTSASYASRATAAMQDTPAGRTAELLNITSRENDPFDFMFEQVIRPPVAQDTALGRGIDVPNAVTLQLDCPQTLALLTRFGGRISGADRRICHWSSYTRPGALRFYAHILRHADLVPLHALKKDLPTANDPRWSRIFALPTFVLPLPAALKRASYASKQRRAP